MTVFGLPLTTFGIMIATILAGSSGAIHYLVVYKILGKPFPGQETKNAAQTTEAE